MTEIDLTTWKRRDHYSFFKNTAYPIYNITFNVAVTNLVRYTKRNPI